MPHTLPPSNVHANVSNATAAAVGAAVASAIVGGAVPVAITIESMAMSPLNELLGGLNPTQRTRVVPDGRSSATCVQLSKALRCCSPAIDHSCVNAPPEDASTLRVPISAPCIYKKRWVSVRACVRVGVLRGYTRPKYSRVSGHIHACVCTHTHVVEEIHIGGGRCHDTRSCEERRILSGR